MPDEVISLAEVEKCDIYWISAWVQTYYYCKLKYTQKVNPTSYQWGAFNFKYLLTAEIERLSGLHACAILSRVCIWRFTKGVIPVLSSPMSALMVGQNLRRIPLILEGLGNFFKGSIFFLSSSDFSLRPSLTCINGRFLWSAWMNLKCEGIKLLYDFECGLISLKWTQKGVSL